MKNIHKQNSNNVLFTKTFTLLTFLLVGFNIGNLNAQTWTDKLGNAEKFKLDELVINTDFTSNDRSAHLILNAGKKNPSSGYKKYHTWLLSSDKDNGNFYISNASYNDSNTIPKFNHLAIFERDGDLAIDGRLKSKNLQLDYDMRLNGSEHKGVFLGEGIGDYILYSSPYKRFVSLNAEQSISFVVDKPKTLDEVVNPQFEISEGLAEMKVPLEIESSAAIDLDVKGDIKATKIHLEELKLGNTTFTESNLTGGVSHSTIDPKEYKEFERRTNMALLALGGISAVNTAGNVLNSLAIATGEAFDAAELAIDAIEGGAEVKTDIKEKLDNRATKKRLRALEKNFKTKTGLRGILGRITGNKEWINFEIKNDITSQEGSISAKKGIITGKTIVATNNITAKKLVIDDKGSQDDAAEVEIKGDLVAKRIALSSNTTNFKKWADYVFANDYRLRSLTEVERYIKSNKHLPEVPSAKEVAENGFDLFDMNATLLKKVEELTLYTIAQEKQLKRQTKHIKRQEERLQKLETLLLEEK
ncbi:hypothetical protein [Aquimarina sp. 2201CG14-23]|uniref:hypothetical protein n=1 Tax=Aquimarina mycalae TaxID=3040073 RepID=UPI002477DEDF|nr:hypothetical protein [Aquimarina sp. 2201CG14-23]MDH7445940.1 hypothetical protein [Aquimarina sp. 2201CG14-23]